MSGALEGFPQKLVGMVDGERREWVVRPGWCAVCTPGRDEGEPQVSLRACEPASQLEIPGAQVTPAYALSEQSAPLAPTGRVFVRFAAGSDAASHVADVAAAGFEVAEVPAYAPHAAWVRGASGSLRDALAGLERLLALPGVRAVEPQLVGERRWRE